MRHNLLSSLLFNALLHDITERLQESDRFNLCCEKCQAKEMLPGLKLYIFYYDSPLNQQAKAAMEQAHAHARIRGIHPIPHVKKL